MRLLLELDVEVKDKSRFELTLEVISRVSEFLNEQSERVFEQLPMPFLKKVSYHLPDRDDSLM